MFQNNLKIAWRNLQRSKLISSINITGLAIGMTVTMLIGLWIYDELAYNRYHKNYDRLAQLYVHQNFNNDISTSRAISLPMEPALRNEFASDFDMIALASWSYDHTITVGEKKLLENGMHVQPDYPEMFSLEMLQGNYKTALTQPNSIIISDQLAKSLFAEESPLGKTVKLNQKYDMEVSGVFKTPPFNSEFYSVSFYLTWAHYLADNEWVRDAQTQWGNHSFQLYAQITEQANFENVSLKIKDTERKVSKDGNPAYFLFPMKRWHLYSKFENGINLGGRIQFVWFFGIIGVFALILACINFMNLSTALSEKRAKEVGIRKSIGSQRIQLIGQFMSESLLVTFSALIFALLLLWLSIGSFNDLAGKEITIPWNNPVFWLVLIVFTSLTGLMAGSYPAFYLSSFEPLKVLKGSFRTGRSASVPRQILVVVQFTVSVALIIGTIVVFNQIRHAKNRPIGYDREGILQVGVSRELYNKLDVFREDLLRSGVVQEVSQSSNPVTGIWSNQIGFEWEGKDPNTLPIFGIVNVSPEFGKTIGWKIKEGRDFSRQFGTDTAALILNEAGVKLTGLEDIVGKTIRWNEEDYQVVGVIEDMIMESPYSPIKPTIFCMANSGWINVVNIKLQTNVPVQSALAKVEEVYRSHNPGGVFDYSFSDEEYNAKFRAEERIGNLARVFAVLAIFISCLGLFGLSTYLAEQRIREIGIRKVLGASIANLWIMQLNGFVKLVVLSILIAIPLAWYLLKNWLSDYEYRIELGWQVFTISGMLALIVSVVTVSFQSVKAALANPIQSLRSE